MKISFKILPPPNKECLQKYPNDYIKCLIPENLMEFIKVPLFIINPAYDFVGIFEVLDEIC
jgi:hypothetical protein